MANSTDDDSSSQEGLLNGEIIKPDQRSRDQKKRWRTGLVLTLVNILISLSAIGVVAYLLRTPEHERQQQPQHTQWSGLQDDTMFSHLKLSTPLPASIRSSFSTPERSSVYLQPPSPQVDLAWDTLSLEGLEMTTVSRSQVLSLGRDPSLLSQVPSSWGLGPDEFFAQIHVFHLIHCLDELRKSVHHEHYYGSGYQNKSQEFFNHKNHCLHILLEELICKASSEIITHNWRETYHVPIADFDPKPRQCRDFDSLRRWAEKNAIQNYKKKWAGLDVPRGAVVLPAPEPRLY